MPENGRLPFVARAVFLEAALGTSRPQRRVTHNRGLWLSYCRAIMETCSRCATSAKKDKPETTMLGNSQRTVRNASLRIDAHSREAQNAGVLLAVGYLPP
jgi:hypothetical protein